MRGGRALSGRRTGAYGGTFDPIHCGHVEVAREVARRFELESLLIIPAHRPPHKDPRSVSNTYHRYTMAVLGMLDDGCATVSTIELESPDRPYTFETVERLRASLDPGDALFFIIGADSFEELTNWREPERILEACNLIVAARPGYEVATSHLPVTISSRVVDLRGRAEKAAKTTAPRGEVYLTDFVLKDISSTEIRKKAREGGDLEGLVPPLVATYISRYGVYRR